MVNCMTKEKHIIDKHCKKCLGTGYVNATLPTGEVKVVKCDCNKTEAEQIAIAMKEDGEHQVSLLQEQITELKNISLETSTKLDNLFKVLEIAPESLPSIIANNESKKSADEQQKITETKK